MSGSRKLPVEEQRRRWREARARYRAKHLEEIRAFGRSPESLAYQRAWRDAHREDCRKTYRASKRRFRAQYPEESRAYQRKWWASIPHRQRYLEANREAGQRSYRLWKNLGEKIKQKFSFYGDQCVYCHTALQIGLDHKKPKSRGGLDLLCNLVPCCPSCNSMKRNFWDGPQAWIRCRDYGVSQATISPARATRIP